MDTPPTRRFMRTISTGKGHRHFAFVLRYVRPITHATSRLTIYTSCPFRGLVESNHPTDGVAYEIFVPLTVAVWYSDFDMEGCVSLPLLTDAEPRLCSRSRSAATVLTPHCWLHGFLALPLTSLRFLGPLDASTNHPVRIYWFGPPRAADLPSPT